MTLKLHSVRHTPVLATLVLSAMLIGPAGVGAAEAAVQSVPQDSNPLSEVQVIAAKLDPQQLSHVAMKFVESHAAVDPAIHQMSRWKNGLCPRVTGLTPEADAFVKGRVEDVARSVGAQRGGVDPKCEVNVEIFFTTEPQKLLDHLAQAAPLLLGLTRAAGDTAFNRAIQAWYLMGTTSTAGFQPSGDGADATLSTSLSDAVGNQPAGITGSYFTKGLTSELRHVLIIVDRGKVASLSVRAIADYVATLSLTHMGSLDTCNELPSIIDVLSSGCGERGKPTSLTDADTAYLKALYLSNRETNLNLEQGEMRDQMTKTILGK
jgi:hypothetical protein